MALRPLIIATIVASLFAPTAGFAQANCFRPEDDRALPFEVFQQAPPPLSDVETDYPYRPLTDASTQNLGRMRASRASTRDWYFLWANRSNGRLTNPGGRPLERKRNFQPGLERPRIERTAFSSHARADACTLAQAAAVLGQPSKSVEALVAEAGVRLTRLADADKAGLAEARDVCVVLTTTLPPSAEGIVLDYEVQDGRDPVQGQAFLIRFARLVQASGRKVILYTNALDAPSQQYTGLNATTAGPAAKAFDRVVLLLWSGNAQGDIRRTFDRQWSILQAQGLVDPGKVLIGFELAGTTRSDAAVARKLVTDNGLAGVMLWRNYARQGGACDTTTNRKIRCLVLGRCGPGD